jgi:hypothetical protein
MSHGLVRGFIPLFLYSALPTEGTAPATAIPSPAPVAQSEETLSRGSHDEPLVELSAWFGATRFSPDSQAEATTEEGFRFGELALWAGRDVRLWYQVDNGLSIDSFDLARADRRVPAHYLGGFAHYQGHYTTRLEVGLRDLPGDIRQKIVRGEQVFLLPREYVVKLGGWWGPREDDVTEWIVHGGFGLPVGDRLRLEPIFFYSRNGLPGERQWRALLSGNYRFASGFEVAAGAAGGQERNGPSEAEVWEGYLKGSVPLGRHRIHLLARREWIESRSTTVLALGLTLGAGMR